MTERTHWIDRETGEDSEMLLKMMPYKCEKCGNASRDTYPFCPMCGRDARVGFGEWIPVEEALPSDYDCDWVLVQIVEPDTGFLWIPCIAEYRKDRDDWLSSNGGWLKDDNDLFKVIAWMPLPEQFSGKGNE